MNRKILISSISIIASLILVGGATFALFNDVGTSSGNVFAAGTLDLQLSNNASTFTDNVTATWSGPNMSPGGSTVSGTLTLRNNGSINASSVDLKFTNVITQALTPPGNATTNDMDQFLKVTTLSYDSTDLLPSVVDVNGNGRKDLADLASQAGDDIIGLAGINSSASKDLIMEVQLDSTAPNDLQGDSVTTTLDVTLKQ